MNATFEDPQHKFGMAPKDIVTMNVGVDGSNKIKDCYVFNTETSPADVCAGLGGTYSGGHCRLLPDPAQACNNLGGTYSGGSCHFGGVVGSGGASCSDPSASSGTVIDQSTRCVTWRLLCANGTWVTLVHSGTGDCGGGGK